MIWIILGCCWVSQIRTKPTKNIWGPLLDSISSYYVQCPWKIVSFFQVFRHLNYHILVFFLAYIGIYRTPAGWYGQEPYLGPAHLWSWRNMGVWDEKIAPKWGGTTNAQFRFSVSYVWCLVSIEEEHWIKGFIYEFDLWPLLIIFCLKAVFAVLLKS